MNRVRCISLTVIALLVETSVFLVYPGTAPAQTAIRFKEEECAGCHARQMSDKTVPGEGHGSVPCLGCHASHSPDAKKPTAQCNKCHFLLKTPRHHAELTVCSNCHTNPHRPLYISLKGADKDACLICHGVERRLLTEHKSKHTALDCSNCHDVHRKIPQCTQCHRPHSGKIVGNCNPCHNAHAPKLASYPAAMPSQECGACHKIPSDILSATTSRHKTLACVFCHQQRHRLIPACQDCHGTPHPAGIMVRFPECGRCHNTAHDLNNWPETATKQAAGEEPTKQM